MLRVTGSSAVIGIVLLMTVCDIPIKMFTTKQFQLGSNFQKCRPSCWFFTRTSLHNVKYVVWTAIMYTECFIISALIQLTGIGN